MERPRIVSARAVDDTTLLVEFVGGRWRKYDVSPLLSRPEFAALMDRALFRSVRVDAGGYGVIWNEDLDLAEHELWVNGIEVEARGGTKGLLWAAEPGDEG